MNRLHLTLPVSLGLLLCAAGLARAQYPYQRPYTNPYGTPAYSPYLNLLRPGSSFANNYYGLVRPEVTTANAILGLRRETAANQAAIVDEAGGLPHTGHPIQFMNTTHYFQNLNTAGIGRGTGPGTNKYATGAQGAAGQKPAKKN
jgi:hypothetical protein